MSFGLPISTDGTLSANSDALLATQKAVKTYVDAQESGDVQGPGSSTVGDLATWDNITGTLLADSGKSVSTDGTLSADSDALIPTQKAVKTYVDAKPVGIMGTVSQYNIAVGAAGNTLTSVGPGSAGQIVQSGGASANPAYSTATYPSTATVTGTVLRANGTNWAASTATYPDTTTAQRLLYSTANNVVGELTVTASRLLATDNTGTVSWASSLNGNFTFTDSTAGDERILTVRNTNNSNTGSVATIITSTGGASAGDARYQATTTTTTWTWGVDNSVTSPTADPWVLSQGTDLGTNNVISVATSGEINYPLQSAFMAYNSADDTGQTKGSFVTVDFDTENFDQNADFSADTFTAPVTGRYLLATNVRISGINSATRFGVYFNVNGVQYAVGETNPTNTLASGSSVTSLSATLIVSMTAGQTAYVQCFVDGGTSTYTIEGDGSNPCTYFCGYLVA